MIMHRGDPDIRVRKWKFRVQKWNLLGYGNGSRWFIISGIPVLEMLSSENIQFHFRSHLFRNGSETLGYRNGTLGTEMEHLGYENRSY